jgi:NAD-dependent DNA ligase
MVNNTQSYAGLVAHLPCSEDLLSVTDRRPIDNVWPFKCVTLTENSFGNIEEQIDKTGTREEYARFVCALAWKQIDLSTSSDRNKAFNALHYIGENWMFGSRLMHHGMQAYTLLRHWFTPKQQDILQASLSQPSWCTTGNETDEVDIDDDERWNAPSFCTGCQENQANPNKWNDYECESYACQTQRMWDAMADIELCIPSVG